jgi:subtilisin family serine protease
MRLESLTGRGIRVGIIDSGVNPAHPHVGGVAGGVFIGPAGESDVYLDYLGHGTAVAGAIREKAPDALLYAVKIFDRSLASKSDILLRAIEWCLAHEMHVINLSLGSLNQDQRPAFEHLLERACAAGVLLVAAHASEGRAVLPGCLPGVLAVGLDAGCPRDRYYCGASEGRRVFHAPGYPRPIPGVPQERNLNGISFAVANMTGFVARARQACPAASPAAIERMLVENAADGGAAMQGAICVAGEQQKGP